MYSFLSPEPGILGEIQKSAAGVPIIPPDTAAFLKVILTIAKPRKILEIGTAIGFSASIFSAFGDVTTIEKDPEMAEKARRNFRLQSLSVDLIEGDALEVLKTLGNNSENKLENKLDSKLENKFENKFENKLEDKFDMIFLDAAKGQYINMLEDCLRILNPGGLLIADNALLRGETALELSEVPRKRKVIHKRMRAFLEEASKRLRSVIVPVGDGIFLGIK